MRRKFFLEFEYIHKDCTNLVGYKLGKEIREKFEKIDVNLIELEKDRLIVCRLPESVRHIDINFVDGFIGDRIKNLGINMLHHYDVITEDFALKSKMFEIVRELIWKKEKR